MATGHPSPSDYLQGLIEYGSTSTRRRSSAWVLMEVVMDDMWKTCQADSELAPDQPVPVAPQRVLGTDHPNPEKAEK